MTESVADVAGTRSKRSAGWCAWRDLSGRWLQSSGNVRLRTEKHARYLPVPVHQMGSAETYRTATVPTVP